MWVIIIIIIIQHTNQTTNIHTNKKTNYVLTSNDYSNLIKKKTLLTTIKYIYTIAELCT